MTTLYLDYETRSRIDLRLCGAYKYAVDPSTEIIIACVGEETDVGFETSTYVKEYGYEELKQKLLKADKIVAHNAFFEILITKFVLGIEIPVNKWRCTMALARYNGIRRANLKNVAIVLNLPSRKDADAGKALIPVFCSPLKVGKQKGEFTSLDDPSFADFVRYCIKDVIVTKDIHKKLGALPFKEQRLWILTQKMNLTGIACDLELAKLASNLSSDLIDRVNTNVNRISNGEIEKITQAKKITEYVGCPNVKKDELDYHIECCTKDEHKKILLARKHFAKTSISKYDKMLNTAVNDRLFDLNVYYKAHTGRFASQGVQTQNFPREVASEEELQDIRGCSANRFIKEYGLNSLFVVSKGLRNALYGDPGLVISDFSSIEPRVLFWLIEDKEMLSLYKNNADPYIKLAAACYSKDPEEVTKSERTLGKIAFLSCMYGAGADSLITSAARYGIDMGRHTAAALNQTYRSVYFGVVNLWSHLENLFKLSLSSVAALTYKDKLKIRTKGSQLTVSLPSGRNLNYLNLKKAEDNALLFDNKRLLGTQIVENIVQAIARDVLRDAMIRLDEANYKIVLSVHDEVVIEAAEEELPKIENLMLEPPVWAKDLPISCETLFSKRYTK
jgi:DNA polymerase